MGNAMWATLLTPELLKVDNITDYFLRQTRQLRGMTMNNFTGDP